MQGRHVAPLDLYMLLKGLELFRRHLRPDFAAARPELAAALQSHKLSNCGVAALEIDFSAAPGDPLVAGAQLLFGTRLVP